ncbi:MAG: polysaccharide biosynthesis/export family protein [Alphaproteobacteria bacterium]|nr:polysaccharide biosynthesis/export family protein [Alphaproteobacteria bacterium]
MKSVLNTKFRRKANGAICAALIPALLAGCSSHSPITNLEPVAEGRSYQAEYRAQGSAKDVRITPTSASADESRCLSQAPATSAPVPFLATEMLNTGDLLDVAIGTDVTLSGKYEVSSDGAVKIRDVAPVMAFGRSVDDVARDIAKALVKSKFYNVAPAISVRLADYGAARVFVSGAVFEAGDVGVGGSAATDKDTARVDAIGANTQGRRLSHALQNAGGVRPDADLSRIEVTRGARKMVIDARAAITGGRFNDMILLEGDQINVPSRNCFQSALVTPSVVSPPGAKVFMSNLTEPATNNASSAINKDTRELRYGTRMFQALVGMNCVGGSKMTNAGRTAILYSRNPESGKSIVIERNIEELVRNANRDDYDPFILPNDALACYDSGATDVVKVAQSFGIVAGAVVLGRGL